MGSVGLAVSQSMALTMMLQMAARFTADFLGQMTAVERVLEYTKLPVEQNMDSGRKYIKLWKQNCYRAYKHSLNAGKNNTNKIIFSNCPTQKLASRRKCALHKCIFEVWCWRSTSTKEFEYRNQKRLEGTNYFNLRNFLFCYCDWYMKNFITLKKKIFRV